MIKTKIFILAFLEYLIFLSRIIFLIFNQKFGLHSFESLRQKCIVLKFLNTKFQLLKPCHYLWDTLYFLCSIIHILVELVLVFQLKMIFHIIWSKWKIFSLFCFLFLTQVSIEWNNLQNISRSFSEST